MVPIFMDMRGVCFCGITLKKFATRQPTGQSHKPGKRSKPLNRSGLNLSHVCRFIWEWTSARKSQCSIRSVLQQNGRQQRHGGVGSYTWLRSRWLVSTLYSYNYSTNHTVLIYVDFIYSMLLIRWSKRQTPTKMESWILKVKELHSRW